MWKRYSWFEVDPDDLPWLEHSEELVSCETPQIRELSDPVDRADALDLGFDPNHTYYTLLARDWNDHPAGSRVLLEAVEIAIELLETPPVDPSAGLYAT